MLFPKNKPCQMPTTSKIRKVITTDTSCYKAEGIFILARLSHSRRSVLNSVWMSNPLFSFVFCLRVRAVCTCVCVWLRTYLPTGIFLRKARWNKKCTYREIDTDHQRQTASTTPTFSGVKSYVAQSNPLHFWVTFRKIEIIISPVALTCGICAKFSQ